MKGLVTAALTTALGALVAVPAAAAEPDEGREPVPEPVLAETVTDIDGTDVGELELEINGALLRALRGGRYAIDGSLEVEWLVARRLGIRVEPTLSRDADDVPGETAAGISGGASWKLVQDFERQLHVQAEVLARLPWEASPIVQPGDPARPLAFDVRAAFRRGVLTLRGSAGVGVFGQAEHVPLRASFAALLPFEGSGRFGFWGIELDGDGARTAPVVAALDVVPNFAPAGLPFRIGLAVPWAVGERGDRPSTGLFLRIFYESAREIEFASPPAVPTNAVSRASDGGRPSGSGPARRRFRRRASASARTRRRGCRAAARPRAASWRGCRPGAPAKSRARRKTSTRSISPGHVGQPAIHGLAEDARDVRVVDGHGDELEAPRRGSGYVERGLAGLGLRLDAEDGDRGACARGAQRCRPGP